MLDQLVEKLRQGHGLAHKRDLSPLLSRLADGAPSPAGWLPIGDDCAAIPDGDGHLLFAIEGFQNAFVESDPWFAGWCGVMVNLSDIAAMGGRPIAVVDAVWSRNTAHALQLLDGMAAASRCYGVPIAGGHANTRCEREQLAVSVLGRAQSLLTSFDAAPGDLLIAAIDLRGRYRDPFPHWDAATGTDPQRLRGDLEILAAIAEAGLCRAAKDISQAGVLGTLLMMLECSGVGARLEVDTIPIPDDVEPGRWLTGTFPSFGFLLAAPPRAGSAILRRFAQRGIDAAIIGQCDAVPTLRLASREGERVAWDLRADGVMGCGAAAGFRSHGAGSKGGLEGDRRDDPASGLQAAARA